MSVKVGECDVGGLEAGTELGCTMSVDGVQALFDAYKEAYRLKDHFFKCGGKRLSPSMLANGQHYHAIAETLGYVLRLLAQDTDQYDIDIFKDLVKDGPGDLSLILKEEPKGY
ncbi:hypothetical protein [Pectobacterium versatile]|uniref:hypothetical protein n=1 Tax=Pectobacterium versatile TaxID=2488639 RepID=UPI001BB2E4D5|nr:hypothetical protein [Pectobacterium versatile]